MVQFDPAEKTLLVRRYVGALKSAGLDSIDEPFAPEYVNHVPTGAAIGSAAMRRCVASVREMLNLSMTIDEIIANADKVDVRATLQGVSNAAGHEVTVHETQIYRIAAGRIAERWFVVDRTKSAASTRAQWDPATLSVKQIGWRYRRKFARQRGRT